MDTKKLEYLGNYFSLMSMNGGAFCFHTAAEMGFFKPFMTSEKLTGKEVAQTLKTHEHATTLFLNCLVEIKVLDKNGEHYSLSPVMKLLSGDYQNLSSDYWKHLPVLLTQGVPFKKMDQVSDSEAEYQKQVKALEWMMMPSAQYAAKAFYSMMGVNELNILDVGAGAGVWSFAHLMNNPKAKATLADWPAVLQVAKSSSENFQIKDRVSYIEGNFHETVFPNQSFHLAIMGNVTHIETPEGNISLFKKIKESLFPGGALQIFDVFGNHEKGKLAKALYEMGLAIRTVEGRVYPKELLETWLKEAGYTEFHYIDLDIEPFTMGMLTAR